MSYFPDIFALGKGLATLYNLLAHFKMFAGPVV